MKSSTVDERYLIEACIRKQYGAWEAFVTRYGRTIRASIDETRRKHAVFRPDTDDFESYIYEKLLEDDCRRLRKWRREARFSTYLVVVTRNLVKDYCCSARSFAQWQSNATEVDGATESFVNLIEESEWQTAREKAVVAALEEISERQAAIIRLRMQGKTLKEIAELTNRPIGTISVENSRAIGRIKKAVFRQLANT